MERHDSSSSFCCSVGRALFSQMASSNTLFIATYMYYVLVIVLYLCIDVLPSINQVLCK